MADRLYGPAFATNTAPHWLARVGLQTLLITPGSPWKNGSIESINERLRDERLDQEQLDILLEVTVVMERWRHTDKGIRPHSTLMASCAGAIDRPQYA